MTHTLNDNTAAPYEPKFSTKQLTAFIVLAILWVGAYASTFSQLITTWFASTTFEHAILIAPISVWLIHRKKYAFSYARKSKIDVFLGVTALCGASIVFVIGTLSSINALAQFALMSMPLFFVLTIFGLRTLKHLFFPLFFLILSVPFGEFLIPHLQEITADLTVVMLNLFQVPVYREGWYLQIPEGLFHVAEACSGIRFLFSTITIGLLIAHLEIRSRVRQLLFMTCVCLIPIFANGIRAFIMVYIGHVSDMEAAVGFDHLVYGWVFFLIVTILVLLFSRLFYDNKTIPQTAESKHEVSVSKGRLFAVVIIVAIAPIFMKFYYTQQNEVLSAQTKEIKNELSIPLLDGWAPVYSRFDSYETNTQTINTSPVTFHQFTYYSEREDKELITWNNKVYDPEVWSIAESRAQTLNYRGQVVHYKFLELKNGGGLSINLVYTWKVGGNYTANPLMAKWYQLLSKLSLNDFGGMALYAASSDNVTQETLISALLEKEQE